MMHRWLDNWDGVGLITTGMERQFSRHSMPSAEGLVGVDGVGAEVLKDDSAHTGMATDIL